jgi:N-acetylmuramoyl-L-alanine amidase
MNSPWRTPPPLWLVVVRRNLALLLFLVVAIIGMGSVYWFFSPGGGEVEAVIAADLAPGLSAPIFKQVPAKPVEQRLAQSPGPIRVGIIAGHQGFDSGSVCSDGLTEVEINSAVANMVVSDLQSRDVRADLLDEFDVRLDRYSGTALVSIHSDSCTYINELATGFKIAGSAYTDSSQLSICIEQSFKNVTNLRYNENTITPHMTDYHAFRKIAQGTPAIIIEVGFMNLDRDILTNGKDQLSRGLVEGILCYLDSQ